MVTMNGPQTQLWKEVILLQNGQYHVGNINLNHKLFIMALVNKIEKGVKSRDSIHKETECSYFIIHDGSKKYLQLDTYGSDDRKLTGKTSQSIQFSTEAIKQLKELLLKEF